MFEVTITKPLWRFLKGNCKSLFDPAAPCRKFNRGVQYCKYNFVICTTGTPSTDEGIAIGSVFASKPPLLVTGSKDSVLAECNDSPAIYAAQGPFKTLVVPRALREDRLRNFGSPKVRPSEIPTNPEDYADDNFQQAKRAQQGKAITSLEGRRVSVTSSGKPFARYGD